MLVLFYFIFLWVEYIFKCYCCLLYFLVLVLYHLVFVVFCFKLHKHYSVLNCMTSCFWILFFCLKWTSSLTLYSFFVCEVNKFQIFFLKCSEYNFNYLMVGIFFFTFALLYILCLKLLFLLHAVVCNRRTYSLLQ